MSHLRGRGGEVFVTPGDNTGDEHGWLRWAGDRRGEDIFFTQQLTEWAWTPDLAPSQLTLGELLNLSEPELSQNGERKRIYPIGKSRGLNSKTHIKLLIQGLVKSAHRVRVTVTGKHFLSTAPDAGTSQGSQAGLCRALCPRMGPARAAGRRESGRPARRRLLQLPRPEDVTESRKGHLETKVEGKGPQDLEQGGGGGVGVLRFPGPHQPRQVSPISLTHGRGPPPPSRPYHWWPQHLEAREAADETGGMAREGSGLWGLLWVSGLPDPTSEAGLHPAGSPSAPALDHSYPGLQEHPGTPIIFPNYRARLPASGNLPPAKEGPTDKLL